MKNVSKLKPKSKLNSKSKSKINSKTNSKSNSRTRKNLNKNGKKSLMTMKKMRGGSMKNASGGLPKSFSRNSKQRREFKGKPNLSVGAQPVKQPPWWKNFIPGNRKSVVLPPVYQNPSQAGLANPLNTNTGYNKFVSDTLAENAKQNPNINPNYIPDKSHYSNVVPNLNLPTTKIQPIQSPQNSSIESYNKFMKNSSKNQITVDQLVMKLNLMKQFGTPPVR